MQKRSSCPERRTLGRFREVLGAREVFTSNPLFSTLERLRGARHLSGRDCWARFSAHIFLHCCIAFARSVAGAFYC